MIGNVEGLVQCQQRQGRYPFSALIPVGIIKSQPCPASLLAAALLGDTTDDLGDAEEPEKGTFNHENSSSSLRSERALLQRHASKTNKHLLQQLWKYSPKSCWNF